AWANENSFFWKASALATMASLGDDVAPLSSGVFEPNSVQSPWSVPPGAVAASVAVAAGALSVIGPLARSDGRAPGLFPERGALPGTTLSEAGPVARPALARPAVVAGWEAAGFAF